jgi:pyruvate/2-oxoacid:ferredoxin oxidoreductase alpha subunit
LRQALAGVSCALVLDRNYSPGMGGILHQEIKSALFAMSGAPRLHGLLAGIGGVNVSAEKIQQLVDDYREVEPSVEAQWVE